ncbi:HAD family phosphatase [uncultured Streptomyces sp.]|uniref:HAD family hydrolase n=1 Tax=uncultured Streptomyces sp. TaxID=174707 RepID=UPI002606134C|nr:HAD family phosphatase [uncultured Streptomyces sp.]
MTSQPLFTWTPSAIVFDCDGTLMDTERHWQDARNQVFHGYGLRPTPGFAERAKGVHYVDCGALMAEESGKPELAEEMAEGLLARFMALVDENPVTMPGAPELVRTAAGRMPLAVASNCPLEMVESCLDRAGLLSCFNHVVVAGGEVRPKPEPDVYAVAARLCGVPPQDALAVEDTAVGVASARRAGLRVLGSGPRPGGSGADSADLWVASLADPAVAAWARTHVGGTVERPE